MPRVSRCPSYRYAVVLFEGEPIGESIARARARVHLFVPLIYLIHSRFYLAPRTCVNFCALWNNQPTNHVATTRQRISAMYGFAASAVNRSTYYGFNAVKRILSLYIFCLIIIPRQVSTCNDTLLHFIRRISNPETIFKTTRS